MRVNCSYNILSQQINGSDVTERVFVMAHYVVGQKKKIDKTAAGFTGYVVLN